MTNRPPSPPVLTPTRPQPSEEEIERKLLAAKERREVRIGCVIPYIDMTLRCVWMLQANRSINDVDEKISQAVQKRQEIESTFINKTKESLDAKMEESQEKREAHMNSLKTKLKDHVRENIEIYFLEIFSVWFLC